MATATTVGDVTVEESDGVYYLAFDGSSPLPRGVGGFRTLEAATAQAQAVWNLRLRAKLEAEVERMPLASPNTTDRLLRALDGLGTK